MLLFTEYSAKTACVAQKHSTLIKLLMLGNYRSQKVKIEYLSGNQFLSDETELWAMTDTHVLTTQGEKISIANIYSISLVYPFSLSYLSF